MQARNERIALLRDASSYAAGPEDNDRHVANHVRLPEKEPYR